jgi:hypothetical protein
MPYILKKTNGTTLATVQDASVDNSTSLTFVGRNYSGYGQPIEENLVKLLENFANTTAPKKPVQGQLWFNSSPNAKRLLISHDGTNFRDIANVPYSISAPTNATTGDLWWDSSNSQIKVYNSIANTWTASQPSGGYGSQWDFTRVLDATTLTEVNSIKATLAGTSTLIISNIGYTPDTSENLTQFPVVKKGITLSGTNPNSGVSSNSTTTGSLLWGTASDALRAQSVIARTAWSTETHYIPMVRLETGQRYLYTTSTFNYNLVTGILSVTAASALYADLAERYESDGVYDVGTVLVLGGINEVTITDKRADTRVAGIVSKNPAYLMNSEAGTDETHPPIALKGRVFCKVVGSILKGDMLVTSTRSGYAEAYQIGDDPNSVIGKAIEDFSEGSGVIEVKV